MERIRVLIAEDNRYIQKLYDHGLDDDLFIKRFVDNGRDALKVYASWQPEIIILDFMIPEKNGYAVLKEIRREIGDVSTPVIVATFMSPGDDFKGFRELGIQGYLVKPFRCADVVESILGHLQKTAPERARRVELHLGRGGSSATAGGPP